MRERAVAGHAALLAVQACYGLLPIFGTLALAEGGFSPLGSPAEQPAGQNG